ncbi:MAG: hypothetical protein ACR2QF_07805 [Geminicoccaceae bacterium]
MLSLPDPPVQSPLSIARRPELRVTPLGEEMGARVREGFEQSFIGQAIEDATLPAAPLVPRSGTELESELPRRTGFMTEESYRASSFFREGVEWDERMTPERAEALAEIVDQRDYRQSLFERSPGGVGRAALGFGAALVGAAPDPVNYIPFFGPAARVAAVGRLGQIGGRVAVGSAEGALGAALVSPYVMQNINRKGGDIGAGDVAMDIVLSAVLGGAFGAGAGAISKMQAARALRTDGAKRETIALSKAVEDLAADEPVNVGGTTRVGPELARALQQRASRFRGDRLAEEIDLPSTAVLTARGRQVTHTGPMDIVTWIRSQQGVRDSGGELRARDLTARTKGRSEIPFVGREAAYGPLVNKKAGMRLDEAANRAWEVGYFPGRTERPTPDDLLEAIDQTIAAGDDLDSRRFAEQDFNVLDRIRAERDEMDIAAENAEFEGVRPADDDAELFDQDFSPETEPDLEDIPFFDESDQALAARSTPRSDYADVPHETLDDAELLDIEQMRAAGELEAVDEKLMREADEVVEKADQYAVGYETLAGCVIRHG